MLQAVVWEHTKSPYAHFGYKCPGVFKKNPKHKTDASTQFHYVWHEAAKEDVVSARKGETVGSSMIS